MLLDSLSLQVCCLSSSMDGAIFIYLRGSTKHRQAAERLGGQVDGSRIVVYVRTLSVPRPNPYLGGRGGMQHGTLTLLPELLTLVGQFQNITKCIRI